MAAQSRIETNRALEGGSYVLDQQFDQLVENVQDYAIYMIDKDGRIISWNAGAVRAKGYTAEEVMGRHFSLFFTPEDVAAGKPARELEMAAREGRHEDKGWRIRKDGSKIWVSVILTAIKDGDGALIGFTKITRDITERRIAEEKLRQSEERFRLVFDAAPNAMVMTDQRGVIVLVNAEAETLFGYTRAEFLGKTVESLVPERFRLSHPDHREQFHGSPRARSMGAGRDLYGLRKDGIEVPIEIGLNPITTSEGTFVLAAIIDITERKRADEAVRQSEERFRAVVDDAPNAMIMVDRTGRMMLVNAQAEQLFGYTREELFGRRVDMLVPERYRGSHAGHRGGFMSAPSARSMGTGRDLYGLRKDGTEVPLEIGLNPIQSSTGDYVLASIIDITGRKQAENALRSSLAEKETLLKEVHHRVKNNMQVISSILKLQSSYLKDPADVEMFDECQMRVRTMALIHERLYQSENLASINFGQQAGELATMLVQSYSRTAPNVRLKVETEVVALDIDTAVPLGLIVNELITNSLKYAFPGGRQGTLFVTLNKMQDELKLTIQDDGVGLPADFDLEKTGSLGLKMVRSLSRQIRARLEVKSEGGAVFIVSVAFKPPVSA